LLEGVGEALIVPAGIIGKAPDVWLQQGRVAEQDLVRLVTVAQPQLVRTLAIPGERSLAAGDLIADAILAAGRYLRNRERAGCSTTERQQDRAVILRADCDRFRLGRLLGLALECLDRCLRALPGGQHGPEIGAKAINYETGQ